MPCRELAAEAVTLDGFEVPLLLALVRASAWVVIAPPFNNRMIPAQVKVGVSAALALARRADSRCVVRKDSFSRARRRCSATLSMPGRRA